MASAIAPREDEEDIAVEMETVTTPIMSPTRPDAPSSLDTPIDLLNVCTVDRAPMQLSVHTPLPRLHLLFVLLGLKQALIVDAGRLVGVLVREDLMEKPNSNGLSLA